MHTTKFSSPRPRSGRRCILILALLALGSVAWNGALIAGEPPSEVSVEERERIRRAHDERPTDDFVEVLPGDQRIEPAGRWLRGGQVSVQVNVGPLGGNIVGDAANEPSIAVDPTDPSRMAIGWRQFDSIGNSFRQAGFGSSADGGVSWTAGVIEGGIFRSDPVLDADGEGTFYYNSLAVPGGDTFQCDVFRSTDGGASWDAGVFAAGGDKQWMAIDKRQPVSLSSALQPPTEGGIGHVYSNWNSFFSCCSDTSFVRSIDRGDSYEAPVTMPQQPFWGTTAVGPEGEVYVVGRNGAGQIVVAKSTTLRDSAMTAAFDSSVVVDLDGSMNSSTGPNPGGLLGQAWVAVDPTAGPRSGWVYVLISINPPGADPLDVHFVRSEDGGATWSTPVRLNDDQNTSAWQWFGTLSVAPNGRLDAIWNDTRNDPGGFDSELMYAFSHDGGASWSSNLAVSPAFDPHLGWPQQNKIGDYYDMVSDNDVVHVAYSATFNGEQDVYYLGIERSAFLFDSSFESGGTTEWSGTSP